MAVYNEKNKTKWASDGRHWYFIVSYRDVKGNRHQYHSKMYFDEDSAIFAQAKYLSKHTHTENINFEIASECFFEEYRKRRKESSYESYLYVYNKHILPYFKDYNVNAINLQHIKNWKDEIENKGYTTNYNNKLYNVLKNIFNYAIRNYGLTSNPIFLMGRFEKRNDKIIADDEKTRYISLNNFNIFISCVDDTMWKNFFIFLFYTGCRKGEVLALNWHDIDFTNDIIIVNKTLYYKHEKGSLTSTKTGINRKVKMSSFLSETLLNYKNSMKNYADFSENWFVFGNSRFLAPATIDRIKNKYFELANIPAITIHEFRHSHVSLLINEYVKSGGNDTTKFFLMMSDRMGHSIEVMKRTYLHFFPTVQDDIVDLLNNL